MKTVRGIQPGAGARAALIAVLAGCAASSATGAPPVGPGAKRAAAEARGPEAMAVPTRLGVEIFLVDQPDALTSSAARANVDQKDRAGNAVPPTPGYTVTATVVVQADDIQPAMATILASGAKVSAAENLPGFWYVTAGSVRAAATLAGALRAEGRVQRADVDTGAPMPLRDAPPTDPGYAQQWHLDNSVMPIADLNVVPAWALGFTGAGVTIGVCEDGFTQSHPDIINNYDAAASMSGTGTTSHGTSVAGVAAARANNAQGGSGVAFGGKVSKLYRGTTGASHAAAFGHLNNLNHIKSNSWGPSDNNMITYLAADEQSALANACSTGRAGLGTVFCWAAGNGGVSDRVDYDPLASSRYTISIGAIDDTDTRAYYNESGSSMFVVAHSSSDGVHRGIYTTAGSNSYTAGFGGTSSASPAVAGVVALMLQANPTLGWRDVKHILARTARRNHPASAWAVNGGGHPVSYDYGFGAVDAAAAVSRALTWRNVPAETSFSSGLRSVGGTIPDNSPTGLTRTVSVPQDLAVESVEVVVNVTIQAVGDLRVVLTSPSGTQSVLAVPRNDLTVNYTDFVFTSARHWDERAAGVWTLKISDEVSGFTGTWNSWQLRVYGNTLCRADWDHSGIADPADAALYIQNWLADVSAGTTFCNLDGDFVVTPADLAAFVNQWYQAVANGC